MTAFFVYLVQKCMTTPEAFLESGMHYFAELVNSTCFNAAVIVLSRVVATFPARMHLFTANTSFRDCVERLIHADESHYAVQILMGADKFPGVSPFLPCLTETSRTRVATGCLSYRLPDFHGA